MGISVDIASQLFPNVTTLLVQLCATLLLFIVVKVFLWKPVMKFFEAREEKMQSDLDASENAKQEALKDRQTALSQLKEASDKADQMIEAAQKQAKQEKDAILLSAQKEANATRKKAQEQIEAERQSMYDDMKKEMVNVALAAASKIMEDNHAEELDRQAIDAFVKESVSHDE